MQHSGYDLIPAIAGQQDLSCAISEALAANLPGNSTPNPNVTGVGLTASVTSGSDSINNVPLAVIKQPALFVHHVNDACTLSPYIDATSAAYTMMIAGTEVTFNEIVGGTTTDPDPCEAATYHGFSRAAARDFIKKWVLSLKR